MRGDVERFEVVEVVFDLGPFDDLEAEVSKERLDPLQGPGDRMEAPGPRSAPGKGDVDPIASELGVHRGPGQRLPARAGRLLQGVLELVERLAGRRPFFGGERAEAPEPPGDDPLAAEETGPHPLHFFAGRGGGQRGEGLRPQVFGLGRHEPVPKSTSRSMDHPSIDCNLLIF